MTSIPVTDGDRIIRTPAEIRKARYLGITYLLMAVFVLWAFAFGSLGNGDGTFGLARRTDPGYPLDFTFNASFVGFTVVVLLAVMGGIQISRGFGRWSSIGLALAFVLFLWAFLGWAAAQSSLGSFSLVGMMRETVFSSVPIILGALSGVLCERVAVINIAIEGMLLGGAFVAAIVASVLTGSEYTEILGAPLGSWVGVLAAMLFGAAISWVLAVLSVRYRVDQIIVGVVINIFVLGLTSFLTLRVLAENAHLNSAATFKTLSIPLLHKIPFFGPVLFSHTIFVYATFLLVAFLTYALFKTRWGLRSRAVGEHPKAADTVGVNVYRFRYLNVMLGGLVAGFGGAWFTLSSSGGRFDENMTNGTGYIGLAAMIFGR